MPKEFNLDDYKYVEEFLSFSEWMYGYKPLPNHLNPEARLSGLLYEHEGDQWQHIMQLPVQQFWTVYEEEGQIRIRNGYQVRGRIGYVVCDKFHNAHGTIIINGVSHSMVDHTVGHDH